MKHISWIYQNLQACWCAHEIDFTEYLKCWVFKFHSECLRQLIHLSLDFYLSWWKGEGRKRYSFFFQSNSFVWRHTEMSDITPRFRAEFLGFVKLPYSTAHNWAKCNAQSIQRDLFRKQESSMNRDVRLDFSNKYVIIWQIFLSNLGIGKRGQEKQLKRPQRHVILSWLLTIKTCGRLYGYVIIEFSVPGTKAFSTWYLFIQWCYKSIKEHGPTLHRSNSHQWFLMAFAGRKL